MKEELSGEIIKSFVLDEQSSTLYLEQYSYPVQDNGEEKNSELLQTLSQIEIAAL